MEEDELKEDVTQEPKGFGAGGAMNFKEYGDWLKQINAQAEEPTEEQITSDARLKNYVNRGFGGDNVLRKMVGVKMMSNGVIPSNLLGYFVYRG